MQQFFDVVSSVHCVNSAFACRNRTKKVPRSAVPAESMAQIGEWRKHTNMLSCISRSCNWSTLTVFTPVPLGTGQTPIVLTREVNHILNGFWWRIKRDGVTVVKIHHRMIFTIIIRHLMVWALALRLEDRDAWDRPKTQTQTNVLRHGDGARSRGTTRHHLLPCELQISLLPLIW